MIPGTKICSGDKTVLSQSKLFCPNDVGDKIVLSRDYTLPARGTGLRLSRCLSGHTQIFFSIERDWPSRRGSSRLLRTDNLRHLDFSQRRNENSGRIIRSGSSRHDWTDLFLLYHFLTKKKWEARNTRQTWFFQAHCMTPSYLLFINQVTPPGYINTTPCNAQLFVTMKTKDGQQHQPEGHHPQQ